MKRWQDRVAVVTGAAAGIGACLVKDFLKEGMIVVGLDKDDQRMYDLKSSLSNEYKGRFYTIKCDVTIEQDVDDAFDRIIADLGAVDLLVNNAGVHYFGKLSEVDMGIVQEVVNTNVMSVVHCTQRAFKSMRERNFDGHIIMMNSISGHKVLPLSVGVSNMYMPTKFAMTAMTDVLRQEFRDLGTRVKVSNVCPGLADTEMVPDSYKEKLIGRLLKVEDISQIVLSIINTPPHVQVHDIIIKAIGEAH